MATRKHFNQFYNGYVTAALWSTNDESDEPGGEPLDANYDKGDLSKECARKMKSDCVKFMRANKSDLEQYVEKIRDEDGMTYTTKPGWGAAGHDFWLTRNGHGAGFWDRGVGAVGDRLTKACEKFGEVWLYVGDDGEIHC